MKEILENELESFTLFKRRVEGRNTTFEAMQKEQTDLSTTLQKLEDRFTKNMGMIKNFIDEKQNFVNKLERRVLQLEHVVFNTPERIDHKDTFRA